MRNISHLASRALARRRPAPCSSHASHAFIQFWNTYYGIAHFVVTLGGKRLYFSGDTENIPEARGLKNIDVAFVCMNLPYTMTPTEAAAAGCGYALIYGLLSNGKKFYNL